MHNCELSNKFKGSINLLEISMINHLFEEYGVANRCKTSNFNSLSFIWF